MKKTSPKPRRGRPPGRSVRELPTAVRLPEDLLAAIDARCRRLGLSRSEWIRAALERAIALAARQDK